ncbi:MAG: hypothetical protein HQK54_01490 [Oligoflexales bacterium]|nr:hypothetical protein [Oligoflexales bacterium]
MKVHGPLGDNVNLATFDELISNVVAIDCSSITEVSWIGLASFNRYLIEKAANAVLVNMPCLVFRYFRLFPDFGKRYRVQSYEIPIFDVNKPDEDTVLRQVEASDVSQMLEKGMYDTISRDGPRVEGNLIFWCPSCSPHETSTPTTFVSPWVRDNTKEFCFWRNFIAFTGTTIGLATDLLSSSEHGLVKLLNDIKQRVDSIESGLARIQGKEKLGLAKKITTILDWVGSECQTLSKKISEVQVSCDRAMRRLQAYSANPADDKGKSFYTNFEVFVKSVLELGAIVGKIEDVGVKMGQKMLELRIIPPLKSGLLNVESSRIVPDILEKAREDFNIMDPLSEGSWPETREEVFKELAMIDSDTGRCVVLLQGFDLVRQVLEHRIIEGDYLTNVIVFIQNGEKKSKEAQDAVLGMIKQSMVTDQEKFAFLFFFSDFDTREEKHPLGSPGQIMLF